MMFINRVVLKIARGDFFVEDIDGIALNEQYFFMEETSNFIASLVGGKSPIAFLCCPSLSYNSDFKDRDDVLFLDIDERFPKVQVFDIARPRHVGHFNAVVVDPPFFNVSLTQLKTAILLLLGHDVSKMLLITYLARRREKFEQVFHEFTFQIVGEARYTNVVECERNHVLIFLHDGTIGR